MKTSWAATLAGAALGVVAAASVLVCIVLTLLWKAGIPLTPFEAGEILWKTSYSAGPPAVLLTAGLAAWLRRGVEAGRPRGSTLAIGGLAGLLLGLLALVPAMWLYGEGDQIRHLLDLTRGDTRINLAVALAGGAAGGVACAWVVSRKKP